MLMPTARDALAWDVRMTAPLDPVIAEIIPLLPLRDPNVMTPQSARDALRALAASRAHVPPPPVNTV
jgi:acetyl esterase